MLLRFQHSNDTISKWAVLSSSEMAHHTGRCLLNFVVTFAKFLISGPFYNKHVHLLSVNDTTPYTYMPQLQVIFPFFQDAIEDWYQLLSIIRRSSCCMYVIARVVYQLLCLCFILHAISLLSEWLKGLYSWCNCVCILKTGWSCHPWMEILSWRCRIWDCWLYCGIHYHLAERGWAQLWCVLIAVLKASD